MKTRIPGRRFLIFDRDATLISSREIAYACYLAAFEAVVAEALPALAPIDGETHWREYHPFEPALFYRRRYPSLEDDAISRAGDASWRFYLEHAARPEFNPVIPAIPDFVRTLKRDGFEVVVLTSGRLENEFMEEHGIPVDACYSMVRMREKGLPAVEKGEAISYILGRHGRGRGDAVTIGDNPRDHVEGIASVGAAYGLGSATAREELRGAVDHFAESVEDFYPLFGLKRPG
ncbi:MAG TPA: hypothetical protein PK636_05055 [bacterium]|nr:hypothetical protein [bacterium]